MVDQPRVSRNYLYRVRGITLLPREQVAQVFSLRDGLVDEPVATGQLLITTNQRIIFFREEEGSREATLLPVEELKGVVVSTIESGSWSILRGIFTLVGALAFYLLVTYWVSGRVDSPDLPLLNMDLIPVLLLAVIVVGAWLYWRHGVRWAGGNVTLQGSSWNLTFALPGSERIPEVNSVVECLYICREERWRSLLHSVSS